MVGSERNETGWSGSAFLIVTNDLALLEILGAKLRQWGAKVLHHDPADVQTPLERAVDVILVDVRHHAEKMLGALRTIREATPCAEMVLINRSGNVNGSMAGMRAGASDEVMVPFDMEALKTKVSDACRRSRTKVAGRKRRSLFTVFADAMSAAAFAQAGEFETAVSMLDGSGDENEEGARQESAKEGIIHGNTRKR